MSFIRMTKSSLIIFPIKLFKKIMLTFFSDIFQDLQHYAFRPFFIDVFKFYFQKTKKGQKIIVLF